MDDNQRGAERIARTCRAVGLRRERQALPDHDENLGRHRRLAQVRSRRELPGCTGLQEARADCLLQRTVPRGG